nr:MAG TPA: hypothetical protein [Caudoviricetes sp.]
MEDIKGLMRHVREEVADAKHYIKDALAVKATNPETADLYYRLSGEELTHMNALHKDVVRLIDDYRREKGYAPEGMMPLYKYLHEEAVEEAERVSVLQEMYKKM